jgi:hypothetical protein
MKGIFFFVLVVQVTNSLVAQQKIPACLFLKENWQHPMKAGYIFLIQDKDGKYVRDSTQTQKGLFEFKGVDQWPHRCLPERENKDKKCRRSKYNRYFS